jgi:hypothetical protein
MKKHLLILVTLGGAVACGGAQPQPNNPTTTAAHVEPAKKQAEPETPAPVAETPAPAAEAETPPAPEPPKQVMAEPCDGAWVCVSVSTKNKIEKRLTQLIGDPAFESTQSGMIDDARGPAKIDLDGKAYEIVLRRIPGGNQVVLRGGSAEVVLDKHKADDFTYVGVIATKGNDGAVLVDIKYMK